MATVRSMPDSEKLLANAHLWVPPTRERVLIVLYAWGWQGKRES